MARMITKIVHGKEHINIKWSKDWLRQDLTNAELVGVASGIVQDIATMLSANPKDLCFLLAGAFEDNPTMRASKSEETAEEDE